MVLYLQGLYDLLVGLGLAEGVSLHMCLMHGAQILIRCFDVVGFWVGSWCTSYLLYFQGLGYFGYYKVLILF